MVKQFTKDDFKIIRKQISLRKSTDELCMLVYLLLETKLKIRDLLGWFNTDVGKRRAFLENHNLLLEEYETFPCFFPKTHQGYLLQWKMACLEWLGKGDVTFEMLKRPPDDSMVKINTFTSL